MPRTFQRRFARLYAFSAPLIAALLLSCGGGGPDDDVVITISPTTASVAGGETVQFTATVSGSSNTKVNWGASGGAISSDGLYTAPAVGGGYAIRVTSDANDKRNAVALVNVTGDGSVLEPFYDSQHPYVQVMTPMPFATYFAPATIRMWANAPDNGNDAIRGFSPQVDFYLGTTMVGSVSVGGNDPVDYYQVDVTGVAAGSYEVFVRSRMASGTVESLHVPITVIDVPASAQTRDLASDLVLSGNANFELIGTPTARAVLTSNNGSRIRSTAGWSGHLTIRNADIIGLGKMDVPGIEVTVTGNNALEITDSVFDRCGPPRLTAADQAPITFRGNTLQPNILTPANDTADYDGSHPSLVFAGNSTAPKVFQGNNVGVSFVRFDHSSPWLIGGDHDADGNVIIGVRGGIEIDYARDARPPVDITIRGNFSYHRYPFGWSQGHNLDFIADGMPSPTDLDPKVTVEHNVFRGSSWMIQSLPDGEFRYNLLVDNINEAFLRGFDTGTRAHHNVLVNAGYQRVTLPSAGVYDGAGEFYSNTVDVGGERLGWFNGSFMPSRQGEQTMASVRNNVFSGFAYQGPTDLIESGAAASADYNCFSNPDTTSLRHYANSAFGAHDCGAGNQDLKFMGPRVIPFPIGDGDVWRRRVTVSQILTLYRGIYTPAVGSPLIDSGDAGRDGSGIDIGAIGAGAPHPDDQFGRFGP